MAPVKVTWHDKAFDKHVDGLITKLMRWIGLRGAVEAKIITEEVGAVDTGFFIHSLTSDMRDKITVWIGSFVLEGPVEYAIHILRGTARMPARPILRMMLSRMKTILRSSNINLA